jgi:hypothetical protein
VCHNVQTVVTAVANKLWHSVLIELRPQKRTDLTHDRYY